jgi:hypothetical protein
VIGGLLPSTGEAYGFFDAASLRQGHDGVCGRRLSTRGWSSGELSRAAPMLVTRGGWAGDGMLSRFLRSRRAAPVLRARDREGRWWWTEQEQEGRWWWTGG